ncbi:MAG: hypothetical protein AB1476_05930 [Candidatus Hadarchaeota archaeon]
MAQPNRGVSSSKKSVITWEKKGQAKLKIFFLFLFIAIFIIPVVYVVWLYKGEKWTQTWEVKAQENDLITGEKTAKSYFEMARYIENRTLRGENYWVYKFFNTAEPDTYSLYYYLPAMDNRAYSHVIREYFRRDEFKIREEFWDKPLFLYETPLRVGNTFSDNGTFSESDFEQNTSANAQITTITEVVRKENVTVPAGTFESYVLRQTGQYSGTIIFNAPDSKIEMMGNSSFTQISWIPESQLTVKVVYDSTTVWTLGGQLYFNKTKHSEKTLVGYVMTPDYVV